MIALRTATIDDLDAIMALETASFGLTAWARQTMAAEMTSEWGRYVVAVDDSGAVVGYVGLRAVGEGIQTEEAYRFLADSGCDFGHGFLMGRPMPATELAQLALGAPASY